MFKKLVHLSYLLIYGALVGDADGKYVEGELDTSENWAFIARFCFLSEDGQFEYYIEYNEEQGEPNLLLYYDAEDQWPAVYKSNKTCEGRESVLKVDQNQIVNLTTRWPAREGAGCIVTPMEVTVRPKYTLSVPTMPPPRRRPQTTTTTSTTQATTEFTATTTKESYATTESIESDATTSSQKGDATTSSEKRDATTSSQIRDATTSSEKGDATTSSQKRDATTWRDATTSSGSKLRDATTSSGTKEMTTTDASISAAEGLAEKLLATGATMSIKTTTEILADSSTLDLLSATEFTTNLMPVSNQHSTTTEGRIKVVKRSIPLKPAYNYHTIKGSRTVVCRNARRFRSSRERWWFIAVSNCNGSKGIHIKYKILMTNGQPGDYWHEHFSADEFYVLPVLMAFSVAYSFLLLAIVICSIELKSRQLLHSTYKLFVLSVVVQFFSIVFKSMAFLKYATNGIGAPKLKTISEVFMGISETCFLLLLLLLAKGYTVTRGRLPLAAGIKLTIFMCLYVVTYVSLFIYEAKVFDPGEVLYTYESPAGYGLIILRIVAWCMFIYSTVFTLKHYPEKANFYYPFNVFGTLWFIAGPAFIISANTYIDKWVRESIVCAVLLFITFGGHLMFLLLTMPSVANKNFPYHVRTTQIGVMELTGTAGNSSIEQFGHHTYEPTTNTEQTVIIPLTRRTEEIFGGLYSQHMHTSLRGSQRHQSGDVQMQNGNDVIMENVLSWSLAKNLSALDVAHFDKVLHDNLAIDPAELEERGKLAAITDGAPSAPPSEQSAEWVKEVPVELFTVSKMVITKQTRQQHEDSD